MKKERSLWHRLVGLFDRFLAIDFDQDIIELDEAEVMEDLWQGREPLSVVALEDEDLKLAPGPVHAPIHTEVSIAAAP